MEDVKPKFLLSSSHYSALLAESVETIVVVSRESVKKMQTQDDAAIVLPYLSPRDEAYVMYTSGSTRKPKGAVIHHRGYLSALLLWTPNLGPGSGMLPNSSCACSFANLILLRIAGSLEPKDVPGLKVLVLGGEHATVDNIKTWAEHVNLINSYGPAECAIWCCRAPNVSLGADPASLGYPVGAHLWITVATDPDKLTPIGCTERLLSKTQGGRSVDGSGRHRHFYRTGDLVRYSPTGDILFFGRRDTQAKLHGQRIELGEIEQGLTKCCPSGWFPVVDILRFPEGRGDVILAAFFHVRGTLTTNCSPDEITLAMSGSLSDAFDKIRPDLEQILPEMIDNPTMGMQAAVISRLDD
ncbi:hypothetical protein LZ554_008805 [Drepanopeziza brunnea f. sp. 'monogermtubi']|nr:hypothetical protein LZ554_008805 [Drepanopeziza brunnea f. sp. 'monogermtubi']